MTVLIGTRAHRRWMASRLMWLPLLLLGMLLLTSCDASRFFSPSKSTDTECGRLCSVGFWILADTTAVQAELENGADPNGQDLLGKTPLGYAISEKDEITFVRILLDAGARVDTRRPVSMRTLLHEAAQRNRHPEVIELLLSRGADINALDNTGASVLHFSTLNADPAVGEMLLDKGLDVKSKDAHGGTPLLWAATYNPNPAIGQMLLDHGADVNAKDPVEATPLHLVVKWAYPQRWDESENLEFKFKAQAIKGRRTLGSAPVAFAELLIERGAQVDAQIGNGAAPLHYSVVYYHESTDLIELLVNRRADIGLLMYIRGTDMTVCEIVAVKPSIQPAVNRRPDLFRRLCGQG